MDKIKKFLGIHVHEFGKWTVFQTLKDEQHAKVVLIQSRCCATCDFVEIHKQSI